jgi:hypothetical protein
MKKLLTAIFLFAAMAAQAQPKPTDLDKSIMDMSYWPANYPILKISGKAKDMPVARLIYSRPLKNNRVIFGGIQKYNELWRLGANESTEIEFFANVKISGKPVAKGRYTLYCIPTENKWTLIVNKDNYSWGQYVYDAKKDLLRTDLDVEKNTEVIEAFTMYFEETKTGANLIMLWDDRKVVLPIMNGDN